MGKQTSTGITLGVVSGLPATEDSAGYGALTFVNVGEVVDLPEYGPTVQVVESNPLATGITEKRAGFTNFGSIAIGLELDIADAGQTILEAAIPDAGTDSPHSFEITYNDGTIEYFHGGVFSYTRAPGSANSMVGSTASVEINSKIVRV
jgi:hypothetical protein